MPDQDRAESDDEAFRHTDLDRASFRSHRRYLARWPLQGTRTQGGGPHRVRIFGVVGAVAFAVEGFGEAATSHSRCRLTLL